MLFNDSATPKASELALAQWFLAFRFLLWDETLQMSKYLAEVAQASGMPL